MPYRRRRRYSRYYNQNPNPPTPRPPADPLPALRKEVAAIYKAYEKQFVVSDAAARADHLTKAFEPLDKIVRIAVVKKQTPDDAKRLWEIAAKCRARALGTTFPEERETAIRTALLKVDRIVANMQVPRFEEAQTSLDTKVAAFAVKAAKKAEREARAADRDARRAARAARVASAVGLPKAPRPPRPAPVPVAAPAPAATIDLSRYAPKPLAAVRSPYQPGSCRAIVFDLLVAGWHTKAECLAAAANTAKDVNAVFHTNFFPYRNKRDNNERFGKWQVIQDADRFRIVFEQ